MLLSFLRCLLAPPAFLLNGSCVALFLLGCGIAAIVSNGREHALRRELRHLRRLGMPGGTSNMANQHDAGFSLSEGDVASEAVRVKSLFIHPIKSCGSIELNRARLTKTGLMYDRLFAVAAELPNPDRGARELSWKFVSQRTKPQMSLIKTELWVPHERSDPNNSLVRAGGCVVVRFPDPDADPAAPSWRRWVQSFWYTWTSSMAAEESFLLPLGPRTAATSTVSAGGNKTEQTEPAPKPFAIHGRTAQGIDMSVEASVAAALPKLKRFLKIPGPNGLTIYRCTPDTLVRTERNLAPLKHIGSPAVHGYTDQQPIHIVSLPSIHAVSALLPEENQPLDALRFRANIFITGAPAFDEEAWKRYSIVRKASRDRLLTRARVDAVLSVVCRTSRCTMPNVDPARGTFDTDRSRGHDKKGKPQPSTTLVQHRTSETGNPAALGYLGMHCVPEDRSLNEAHELGAGLYLEVGDEIEVLERGQHLYGSTGGDY